MNWQKLKLADWREVKGKVYLRIGRSKADQKAERKWIIVEAVDSDICPVKLAVSRLEIIWCEEIGQSLCRERSIDSYQKGKSMSTAGISSVVKRVAKAAGLEGKYSGHSLRIGGASASLEGGALKGPD